MTMKLILDVMEEKKIEIIIIGILDFFGNGLNSGKRDVTMKVR